MIPVDLQVQVETVGQGIHKLVGFGEEVARVDEDHRDVRPLPGYQVQQHRGLDAEAKGQDVIAGQVLEGLGAVAVWFVTRGRTAAASATP